MLVGGQPLAAASPAAAEADAAVTLPLHCRYIAEASVAVDGKPVAAELQAATGEGAMQARAAAAQPAGKYGCSHRRLRLQPAVTASATYGRSLHYRR